VRQRARMRVRWNVGILAAPMCLASIQKQGTGDRGQGTGGSRAGALRMDAFVGEAGSSRLKPFGMTRQKLNQGQRLVIEAFSFPPFATPAKYGASDYFC
jgi:hypothetical protein